ncbi:MAG TPA: type II toxin-antitoxin system VapC family toxin [Roseiflexaceae bacterium]|jgi:PIN domain nuclease of toxin-antitoxin system
MTILAIADTHAVIWYLYDDARLSTSARTMMDDAATSGDQIALSSISLAEMVYLIDKGRIDPKTSDRIFAALDRPDAVLVEIPFERRIASAMRLVDRAAVPDLPDRIIAATAVYLGVPLISRDGKIQMSSVMTIW